MGDGKQTEAARVRAAARAGRLTGPTAGLAPGFVQANLVVLPRTLADDFLLFCQRNPAPCPLVEVLGAGDVCPRRSAPGADIRTDLPRYRVWRSGELDREVLDLRAVWSSELVSFLIGCSFTFEGALLRAGIPLPHMGSERTVAMFRTSIETAPAGPFGGPMVVSMRWVPRDRVDEAVRITAQYPAMHGAPVHIGDPEAIGIADTARPDYGDPWPQPPGSVPVFWACGVTPQAVARTSRPPLMLTHAPGHMLVTDLRDEDFATT